MKWTSQWVEICLDFLVRIVRSGCFSFDYLSVVCPNMGPQCVFVSEIWQSVGENFFRENAIKNSGSFSRNCPKNALPVALLLSYTILLHSPWVSLCFPARQFSSQPSWTPPPTKDCCDGANSLFSRNRTFQFHRLASPRLVLEFELFVWFQNSQARTRTTCTQVTWRSAKTEVVFVNEFLALNCAVRVAIIVEKGIRVRVTWWKL